MYYCYPCKVVTNHEESYNIHIGTKDHTSKIIDLNRNIPPRTIEYSCVESTIIEYSCNICSYATIFKNNIKLHKDLHLYSKGNDDYKYIINKTIFIWNSPTDKYIINESFYSSDIDMC